MVMHGHEDHEDYGTLDLCVLPIICACFLFGVPGNISAIHFFRTYRTTLGNAAYFGNLYTIIAITDLVLCLLLLPIIQAILVGKSTEHVLFRNSTFCDVWFGCWSVVQMLTVLLVAILSVSRLILLINPFKQLRPALSWVVPVCVLSILVATVPLTTIYGRVVYNPSLGICSVDFHNPKNFSVPVKSKPSRRFVTYGQGNYSTDYIPTTYFTFPANMIFEDLDPELKDVLKEHDFNYNFLDENKDGELRMTQEFINVLYAIVIRAVLFGIPVLPIFFSATLSLWYLYRMKKKAVGHNSMVRAQQATITVLTVTFVYVIFNIPTFIYAVFAGHAASKMSLFSWDEEDADTKLEKELFEVFESLDIQSRQIFSMVVFFLLSAINSMINPIIYYLRMSDFKSYLSEIRRGSSFISSTISDAVSYIQTHALVNHRYETRH
eukprot:sb/3464828/